MAQVQFSAYARHETGSSMTSQCYNTREAAETDLMEYCARCVEQGITPIVFTKIQISCAICGGTDLHQKIRNARPHNHRFCTDRCYKVCPQAHLRITE